MRGSDRVSAPCRARQKSRGVTEAERVLSTRDTLGCHDLQQLSRSAPVGGALPHAVVVKAARRRT